MAPEEKDAFERHLESCPPCREELVEVAHMRTEIARHGGAFFGEHPEPEMLGALFGMGETPIDPAEGERIRRHLAVCSSCNEESRWLMGTETAGTAELEAGSLAARTVRPYAASASRWWAQPSVARLWPAAAAAALAVLTTVLIPGPWRGAGSAGPVARGFLEPVRRTGIPEVLVRPEHTAIVLDIVSELTPTEMPARIELLDTAGETVLRQEGLHPSTGEAVFTISVPIRKLPPGTYTVRLFGRTSDVPPTDFPFRIVASMR